MRKLATLLISGILAAMPVTVFGLQQELTADVTPLVIVDEVPAAKIAQNNGGMSLSEAVESVRRRTNGRIVSATTRVQGGREVHHIKVLTKDGKVKTHKVPGRRRQ